MTELFVLPEQYKNFNGINFDIVHGRVIRSEMWTEHEVSGGGSSVKMGSNVAVHHPVSTTSHSFKRFWIERVDGRQSDYVMSASQAPVIEDQIVTVITAGKNSNNYSAVGLINHTADQVHLATNAAIFRKTSTEIFLNLYIVVGLIGLVLILVGAALAGIVFIAPGAFVFLRYQKKKKAYEAFLEQIAEQVAKNTDYETMRGVLGKASAA